MIYKCGLLIFICISISSCDSSGQIEKPYKPVFEDFEAVIECSKHQKAGANSYLKKCSNGWLISSEASIEGRKASTAWDWTQQDSFNTGAYSIRATGDKTGSGDLWLFKSFPAHPGINIDVSVYARTQKRHNGSDTGPEIIVFDGKIELPSRKLKNLIGNSNFKWASRSWSEWTQLSVQVKPTQNYITVGLVLRDAWERHSLHHEFDTLKIIPKY